MYWLLLLLLLLAWTAATPRRPSTCSLTARPQFASGSYRTASKFAPTQRWQVRVGLSRHPCSAPVGCRHHHRRRCQKHSASRIEAQVAWRDYWFQPVVWLSCEKRCKGLQLPHSRSAPCAQSTDWQRRPDSHVQHRRFQAGLLQCTVEWRTGGDFWQTTVQCAKNNLARVVCQSRGRTDARPLLHSLHWLSVRQWVTYKLAHNDSQGADHSWYRPMHHLGLCALPMLQCSSFLAYTLNWPVALFLLQFHPPGTLYLLTFNCTIIFSLSNAIW